MPHPVRLAVLLLFLSTLTPAPLHGQTESFVQEGLASYYGKKFQGRITASGKRLDNTKFTCAHRTLPFGTRLQVTNLNNGRSVIVRVTDRGPFRRGRVVDLTLAAAEAIDMISSGVCRVRVEQVGEDVDEWIASNGNPLYPSEWPIPESAGFQPIHITPADTLFTLPPDLPSPKRKRRWWLF